jgi:hypothetical protein
MYHINLAMKFIVDISERSEEARLVSTNMLPILYDLYLHIYESWNHLLYVKLVINKINDFTIYYYGNLTEFVNNIAWSGGCIPYYWAQYSDELGYDTSGWTNCSSSSSSSRSSSSSSSSL